MGIRMENWELGIWKKLSWYFQRKKGQMEKAALDPVQNPESNQAVMSLFFSVFEPSLSQINPTQNCKAHKKYSPRCGQINRCAVAREAKFKTALGSQFLRFLAWKSHVIFCWACNCPKKDNYWFFGALGSLLWHEKKLIIVATFSVCRPNPCAYRSDFFSFSRMKRIWVICAWIWSAYRKCRDNDQFIFVSQETS